VRVFYELVCVEDGSRHTIEACGVAAETGDKGTAKALHAFRPHPLARYRHLIAAIKGISYSRLGTD
jgi:hypothetical protein